ncbi:MAG: cyclase family protein [Deltaproteobacteria bacterium]|nr:cyclase family protein [Deltaproteobacteria bacterium]
MTKGLIPTVLIAIAVALPLHAGTLVDLTHSFDAKTIYWPTAKPFTLEVVHKGPTPGGFWYEANNICAAEHGGTHVDAPVHFAKGQWTVDQIPPERLIGPVAVIDVSKRALKNPDYLISAEDILAWEKAHAAIAPGTMAFVYTGWSKKWPNKKAYLGTDKPGDVANLHFPGFSPEAANLLVERKIAAAGLDTPSVDYGQSKDFKTHVILAAANILGFENLNQLDHLPATGAKVYALPMKIAGGSGAPLRIFAELP